jgi:hypothetical protein
VQDSALRAQLRLAEIVLLVLAPAFGALGVLGLTAIDEPWWVVALQLGCSAGALLTLRTVRRHRRVLG